jgi:hypothetical protein
MNLFKHLVFSPMHSLDIFVKAKSVNFPRTTKKSIVDPSFEYGLNDLNSFIESSNVM